MNPDDNPSNFNNMKHPKLLMMLLKASTSPTVFPLADAILEEKRKQYEEVQVFREMALRRQQKR